MDGRHRSCSRANFRGRRDRLPPAHPCQGRYHDISNRDLIHRRDLPVGISNARVLVGERTSCWWIDRPLDARIASLRPRCSGRCGGDLATWP